MTKPFDDNSKYEKMLDAMEQRPWWKELLQGIFFPPTGFAEPDGFSHGGRERVILAYITFDFAERLRIFASGRARCEIKVRTEDPAKVVGAQINVSPYPPKWLSE